MERLFLIQIIGGIVMKERLLRKYKQEVSDQSVDFFDYCKGKLIHQLNKGDRDDDAVTQMEVTLFLHCNGIFKGVSV